MEIEKNFMLVTFDTALPFDLVGFIVKTSKTLTDKEIPIFVISSFSTDHILIKEKYLEKIKKKLESLGFIVEELKKLLPFIIIYIL